MKNNSNDGGRPPLSTLRSLRKRKCQSDEGSKSIDPLVCPHQKSQLQELTMTSVQQSSVTKKDSEAGSKDAEATADPLRNTTAKIVEAQEVNISINPNSDSQLRSLTADIVREAIWSGAEKQEIPVEDCNWSAPQTSAEQPSEGGHLSSAAALECNPCPKENPQSNSDGDPDKGSKTFMAKGSEEAAVGLPARKKQRTGASDPTEECGHSLLTQEHECGGNGPDGAERQISVNPPDLEDVLLTSMPEPFSTFTPAESVLGQNEAETQPEPSNNEGKDRAGNEVNAAVIISEGVSAVGDPGRKPEGDEAPEPQQKGDATSGPATEEELVGGQREELQGGTDADLQQQVPDVSADVKQTPTSVFYSDPVLEEEPEDRSAALPPTAVTRTGDDTGERLVLDPRDADQTEAGASSMDAGEGHPMEPSQAAVPPSGSDGNSGSEDKSGVSPASLDILHRQILGTVDPSASESLDYVSDSQLNSIALLEEEEEDLGSPAFEDATDLICGLIGELSSLNRKVMAARRELDKLHRSRSSRSSAAPPGLI